LGAVNVNGVIAGFSSVGYPGKVKPNIVSVGAGTIIAGFNNQPASGNGTSFSNPNVAGLIACLWQAFPNYNNMKILDAVYKSADRFTAPTDRYGFGIPNFRKAYLALKKEQNISLYGNDWLFATPNPFSAQIDVRFIGQVNGNAKLELLNSVGQVIGTKPLLTELEEVYNNVFDNLTGLPGGSYFIKYTDSLKTRSTEVQKISALKDWLVAMPNPFNKTLTIYLKAPETGKASLRLIDVKGRVVEVMSISTTMDQGQYITSKNAARLQRGLYFLQYIGSTQKRAIKLVKQ
jgi:hypothetical protein